MKDIRSAKIVLLCRSSGYSFGDCSGTRSEVARSFVHRSGKIGIIIYMYAGSKLQANVTKSRQSENKRVIWGNTEKIYMIAMQDNST